MMVVQMIKMNISLTGVKEFEGTLDRIQSVLHDFTPELREAGEWYMNFIQNDVWETEGGAIQENWASLNSRYAASKAKRYPGRGVLEASGRMRNAWKLYTTSQYALIENSTDYAIYHQGGTSRIPQRMFVKFTQDVKSTIYDIFEKGVLKRIQNAAR
jgi:phage gpG-like protein